MSAHSSKENTPLRSTQESFKMDTDSQPAPKRRKIGQSASAFSSSQQKPAEPSFAEVLQRLKEEAGETKDAEGGADAWARPTLQPINASKDAIVFQQIDVEDCADTAGGGTGIRMFGVTNKGNSVLAYVTDFYPYFYVACPRGFLPSDVTMLPMHLNNIGNGGVVRDVQMVEKKSLMHYMGDTAVPFLKITLIDQRSLPKIRDKS
ncbi:hypothetical protein QCA50_009157 [Cerrena zonata]|uniref:DNA-directed DNA polymerase n=1 Tax=Cerrena zonata TaxID=2478898 RepID=A0AAW0G2J3_9APHY